MPMKPEPISVDVVNQSGTIVDPAVTVAYARQPIQIGPYRIMNLLGRGGMGSVYKAQVVVSCEVPIGQEVAIKLLRETDEKERRRFTREAAYLQALRHPGIVRVLDAGEYEGQPYLVMTLVEGGHADDLIVPGRPLEQQRVADLIIQALDALQVAHHSGILHRDIKPGNIMITSSGQVKLVDFGLAHFMHNESHLTATGAVVGTPAYMSPEQASGRSSDIGRRADIYSMGACLYEMLTGQQPFVAENSVALLRRIIEEPLRHPSLLRKDLHRDLETVVLKAMAKDFRDRYPSAESMAADLRRFRLGVRIRTARPGQLLPLLRSAWYHRNAIATTGLVVFVATALVGVMIVHGIKKMNQPQQVNLVVAPPVEPPAKDQWVSVYHLNEDLENSKSPLKLKPAPTFGANVVRSECIKKIPGSVRLSAACMLLDDTFLIELLISDLDIGSGYRLRLIGDHDESRLQLVRAKRVVRSLDMGRLPRNQILHLSLSRNDNHITGSLDEQELRPFTDIVPIEGEAANGVYIVFSPLQVKVSDLQLDRLRSKLTLSALELPDNERQQGRPAIAKEEYEYFLKDHPDSPLARDAQLRIGLCLEAMDTPLAYEQALNKFLEVASLSHIDPGYKLTATVHAWGCSLRLGRFEAAEKLFDSIRSSDDMPTLLAVLPEGLLVGLVKDYLARASTFANSDPDRAVKLYNDGTEIAATLGMNDAVVQAQMASGDILAGMSHFSQAIARYHVISDSSLQPDAVRLPALAKIAQSERLSDQLDAAEHTCQRILDFEPAAADAQQWARLWLGDIYLQRNEINKALACWTSSPEPKSIPGLIMHDLLMTTYTPPPRDGDQIQRDSIAYFNARLALLHGRDEKFHQMLEEVASSGPTNLWPVSLAHHLLINPQQTPQNDDTGPTSTSPPVTPDADASP